MFADTVNTFSSRVSMLLGTVQCTRSEAELWSGHEISDSAACFVPPASPLCSCLQSPWGPVASTATSMTRSGTSHCRSSRKRKSKTAENAKMEPATGPQWDLSLRNRLCRGSTSSLDTLSYTWEGKTRDYQCRQAIRNVLFRVKARLCERSVGLQD